jgi:hypothetical protein
VRFRALAPHYRRYSSTTNQSEYQPGVPSLLAFVRLVTASYGIGLALPGSGLDSSATRCGLRPRHVSMLSPLRACLFRLRRNETLGLHATRDISGLDTFTCVAADGLLPSGFMLSITLQHAEFRTELVVNLYSGWIVQLVMTSLSWHTHYNTSACTFAIFHVFLP